ncbi:CDP-diacylglycerol--serine O-phosphatidyltransferase [Magnetococcus marinus MC-1]|uniref:CDP-diacylglycerol--serine O-phosphatidyltransferase n=1 Tax=Magnetococcus marinus (strain ATCC BAA-1437 / JCM 17883 / MC-1) TaxID=156889 RepID=A0L628_MAGMM|nr:CDP-diacylglycerol--serine O-phosphatidyltransferase [Magnetococcus marinus]ABK43421.1 CDP-diacylglycerol--serine O-phosphatidyltransferase [Magnetococcus marinus MC-1]
MGDSEAVKSKRAVYILPNLLTTGGMFFGFYSIIAALTGRFELGAITIFIAAVFDALDGRVARAMGATSAFGKEYDSLADFLSFCIAPAILVQQWALDPFNRVGWAAAFFYTVCGALRLARFNVQHYVQESRISKRYFQGLPSPMAAMVMAGMVLLLLDWDLLTVADEGRKTAGSWVVLGVVLVMGGLMVSSIRFRSFKDFSLHRKKPFMTLVAVVASITLLTMHTNTTLFVVMVGYLLLGIHSHKEYLALLAEGKEVEEDEVEDLSV